MTKSKILAYYQTFTSLEPILLDNPVVTHIHVSSIHFGVDQNDNPYIHLNNNSPWDKKFDTVWQELEEAAKLGIKVKLMVGGAGGGYASLFSNYNVYYSFLSKLLHDKPFISGVDLDIEEPVSLTNVKKLISSIKTEFENTLTLSMAPVQYALETDSPGMGGFVYKDLMQSQEGKCIDYFNVQFYSDFSFDSYEKIVANGYLPEMIVMGAMAGEKNDKEIAKCVKKYGNKFGGVFVWEYCFAQPDPAGWAHDVNRVISSTLEKRQNKISSSLCSLL